MHNSRSATFGLTLIAVASAALGADIFEAFGVGTVGLRGAVHDVGTIDLGSTVLHRLEPALDTATTTTPIIGGSGSFRYQYDPRKLLLPVGAQVLNAHGLVLDADSNIYLNYEHVHGGTDANCLVRWRPDGTAPEFITGGGSKLCEGECHGLTIATEGGEEFLYHANNDQKLTKTRLDGTIIWQRQGNFGQDPKLPYKPTWFAVPPQGDFIYLCDGYGSNNVYVFTRADGRFVNRTYGGRGERERHGKFSTNHGCLWDPRSGQIAVSDRANSRFEYFDIDFATPDKFQYSHTVDQRPYMGAGTLPCNLRTAFPGQEGRSISPDLAGPVAVLDKGNNVLSVVNVSVLLKEWQHDHPHDAILLPNGDMVVATWNPGRLSYWKQL